MSENACEFCKVGETGNHEHESECIKELQHVIAEQAARIAELEAEKKAAIIAGHYELRGSYTKALEKQRNSLRDQLAEVNKTLDGMVRIKDELANELAETKISCTWGDLIQALGSVPTWIEPHEWDNLNLPEQRMRLIKQLAEAQRDTERHGFYVASRATVPARGQMWRALRDSGVPINSSWIDEDGERETQNFSDLWVRIESEIRRSEALILYAEREDFPLKGAYVEVGMALAFGIPIKVVLPGITLEPRSSRPIGSWISHPLVSRCGSVREAIDEARAALQPEAPAVSADSDHGYISTACWHDKHDRCRLTCKFCGTDCRCQCHKRKPQPEAPGKVGKEGA